MHPSRLVTFGLIALFAVIPKAAAPDAAVAAPAPAAASAPAVVSPAASPDADQDTPHPRWEWPVQGGHTIVAPFRAPLHAFGSGHRGADLAAQPGTTVAAPAAGVVAFAGVVVDRPLLTIAHADGYVSTFEPLVSTLTAGTHVQAGDIIGTVASGGHAPAGSLHLGVRLDGAYLNPLLLLGSVERAVLLPCCRAG